MAISYLTVYEYSDTVAEGLVIRTDPEEGVDLAPNAIVTLYVSLGQQAPGRFSFSEQGGKIVFEMT